MASVHDSATSVAVSIPTHHAREFAPLRQDVPVSDTDASDALMDAVALWEAYPDSGPAKVISAAVDALVQGLDSPSLRELAGLSARDSRWTVQPLVEATFGELGISYPGPGIDEIQIAAARVMCKRLVAGQMNARDFASWAHLVIGHEGSTKLQAFVELDDWYDIREYTGDTQATLEAEAVSLANQLLTGNLPLKASTLGWQGSIERHAQNPTTPASALRRCIGRFLS